MVRATMIAPRILPRKINKMMTTSNIPSAKVVQHRVCCVMDQIIAVQVRDANFHARWKNLIIQLANHGVDGI